MGTMDEELQLLRTRAEEAVRLQSELKKVIENTDRVEALYQQEQASVLNYPLSPVSALLFAASGECPLVIPLAGIVTCLDASDICTKLRGSVLTSSLTFTHQPADHYFFLSGVCGCVFTPRPMELFLFLFFILSRLRVSISAGLAEEVLEHDGGHERQDQGVRTLQAVRTVSGRRVLRVVMLFPPGGLIDITPQS